MRTDKQIAAIQRAYPQAWFACGLEHSTRSTNDDGLFHLHRDDFDASIFGATSLVFVCGGGCGHANAHWE